MVEEPNWRRQKNVYIVRSESLQKTNSVKILIDTNME